MAKHKNMLGLGLFLIGLLVIGISTAGLTPFDIASSAHPDRYIVYKQDITGSSGGTVTFNDIKNIDNVYGIVAVGSFSGSGGSVQFFIDGNQIDAQTSYNSPGGLVTLTSKTFSYELRANSC